MKSNEEKPADTEESKEDTLEVRGYRGPELEIPSEAYAAEIQKVINNSLKKQLCKNHLNCEDQ